MAGGICASMLEGTGACCIRTGTRQGGEERKGVGKSRCSIRRSFDEDADDRRTTAQQSRCGNAVLLTFCPFICSRSVFIFRLFHLKHGKGERPGCRAAASWGTVKDREARAQGRLSGGGEGGRRRSRRRGRRKSGKEDEEKPGKRVSERGIFWSCGLREAGLRKDTGRVWERERERERESPGRDEGRQGCRCETAKTELFAVFFSFLFLFLSLFSHPIDPLPHQPCGRDAFHPDGCFFDWLCVPLPPSTPSRDKLRHQ